MSKISRISKTCCICNTTNEFLYIEKADNNGGLDLDTRPTGTLRHDMSIKLQECPSCHYVNTDVSLLIKGMDSSFVSEEEYSVIYLSTTGEERKYLLHAFLMKKIGNYMSESYYYLAAAWACDDAKRLERAIEHRKHAIEVLRPHFKDFTSIDSFLIVCDMYRRSKMFNECINLSTSLLKTNNGNAFVSKMLRYEVELATQSDSFCHNISELQ